LKLSLKYSYRAEKNTNDKIYKPISENSSLLTRLVRISEHKIASYLKVKANDRFIVSSTFGPEFGSNLARLTVQLCAKCL